MKYNIEKIITTSQHIKQEVELLPCPFCGGESELRIQEHCGSGRLTKKWLNSFDAVISWNKRYTSVKN